MLREFVNRNLNAIFNQTVINTALPEVDILPFERLDTSRDDSALLWRSEGAIEQSGSVEGLFTSCGFV